MNPEITSQAIKAAPPIAVSAALAGGVNLNALIGWATLGYIAMQAGYLAWKWRRDIKRERAQHQTPGDSSS